MSRSVEPMVPLLRTLTLPGQANHLGGVFGGWVMAELDKAAGLLGMHRSRGACTTVAVESLRFLAPLKVGEAFAVSGRVESVGRTSMRLWLEGSAEAPGESAPRRIVEAWFVSVALDAAGRPRPVPAE